jgi:AraC-like DNA-binding protein
MFRPLSIKDGMDFMMTFFDKIISNFPEAPADQVKAYSSRNIAMIETTYVPPYECVYSDYHFIIPIRQAPPIIIDSKTFPIGSGSIFSCNPGQVHRAAEKIDPNCAFIALYIQKEHLLETSKAVLHTESLEFENKCFNFTPTIRCLIHSFMEEARTMQLGYEMYLQGFDIQIAVNLLREGRHNLSQKPIYLKDYADNLCINRAIAYLTENFDKNITLKELANEVNYSPFHFLRIFKSNIGITPSEYLLNVKIHKAKNLLKHTNLPITEICYLCGFSSTSYFNQAFKRKTGASPSYYKKNV